MKLDFSKLTIDEVISTINEDKAMDWQLDILKFLQLYKQQECEIEINEMQSENIFTVAMKKSNIQNTVKELNEYIGIKEGDITLISNSANVKDGVISLAQAIEGKMEAYCIEPSNEIKIPYTGQDQNTIHWGLNYIYLGQAQIADSSDVFHRIEKIVLVGSGLDKETKQSISKNENQSIYEAFSVKAFPVAIKKLDEQNFHLVGDVSIERTDEGLLIIESPNFKEKVDTQKAVVINDDGTFRWLTASEYLNDDNDSIINFEYIEKVLEPYIDTKFIVLNFPDKNSGEDVVTLVVERRYMEEFDYPTDELKEHEIPKQTYFLGEYPVNDDRAAIRKEVKRLLQEN